MTTNTHDANALIARKSNLPTTIDKITTDQQFKEWDGILLDAKELLSDSDSHRLSITRPMDAEKKTVIAWFNTNLIDDLSATVTAITKALRIYQGEKQEEARIAAAAAEEKRRKEQARLDARADKKEEQGKDEQAAVLRDRAATNVPAAPQVIPPKAKGVQQRENWQYEVTDESAIPREYMTPDTIALGKIAKAMKGKTNIPGVRAYDANSLAALKAQ